MNEYDQNKFYEEKLLIMTQVTITLGILRIDEQRYLKSKQWSLIEVKTKHKTFYIFHQNSMDFQENST